ncbi:hypothetical protein SBA4_220012 [Candidatus Sulfopaludibacter sp. SbA4]|nr:hypothetical protein SBA4_220012 [Candidatus Sulfopaludibacter sp. SbA4]
MTAREFKRRLLFLFHKNRLARDLEDEMQLHLDLRARKLRSQGLTDATHAAQRQFGNRTALLESMLFQVHRHDAWTYLASVALLAVVSLAASLIPASRGAKVDPMEALRYE